MGSHNKKFKPELEVFYLKENDNRAFIKPVFQAPTLTPEARAELLSKKFSLKELKQLFEDLNSGRKNDWLKLEEQEMQVGLMITTDKEEETVSDDEGSLLLETPKFSKENMGIFVLTPKLSFESIDEDAEKEAAPDLSVNGEDLRASINEFRSRFSMIKSKWTQTFLEVEESHKSVLKDLTLLKNATTAVKKFVGRPLPNSVWTKMTVWDGIQAVMAETTACFDKLTTYFNTVNSKVSAFENEQLDLKQHFTEALEEQELEGRSVSRKLQAAEDKMNSLQKTIEEYDRRFGIIYPLLVELK